MGAFLWVTSGILLAVSDWVGSAADGDAGEEDYEHEEVKRVRGTAVTATRPETGQMDLNCRYRENPFRR